jgi:hypothetical protein
MEVAATSGVGRRCLMNKQMRFEAHLLCIKAWQIQPMSQALLAPANHTERE